MQYVYPCVLTPEDEGGFFVSFPDVPEALTGGDNRAEALAMAEDALAAALGMYVKEREDIPVPSIAVTGQTLVAVPAIVAAKLALYTAMRRQGISKVALAERLDLSAQAVRSGPPLPYRHRGRRLAGGRTQSGARRSRGSGIPTTAATR